MISSCHGLFVPLLWCSHHVGDHLQEDLAKFGYRSEREIEKIKKIPAIYIYILATFWNLLFKYDDFRIFFFLRNLWLWHIQFFNTKNTFVWVALDFLLSPREAERLAFAIELIHQVFGEEDKSTFHLGRIGMWAGASETGSWGFCSALAALPWISTIWKNSSKHDKYFVQEDIISIKMFWVLLTLEASGK
jgi:hypothetical protein